jgi:L-2-hydroxyglutarate oxidase LhgO
MPGFFNLLGIESPGLTAAPAIAEAIASQLDL